MAASYHINPNLYSLQMLKADLLERKLIPSREPLKDGLADKTTLLEAQGIKNLGDLIANLKSKKKLEDLAASTGIDPQYLNLLRREANSYLPNPVALNKFTGFSDRDIASLAAEGIKNSRHIFERLEDDQDLEDLAEAAGVDQGVLTELLGLADLVRAYGVGPAFARILYDTGIHSIAELREYSPQEVIDLYQEQTGKKADFSISDIKFCLDLVQALDIGKAG